MDPNEIEKKVMELSADQAGVAMEQIQRVTHYVNDLNFDSLDTVELAMSLEDEFEISMKDEDIDGIKTVGDAVDYVVRHVGEGEGRKERVL